MVDKKKLYNQILDDVCLSLDKVYQDKLHNYSGIGEEKLGDIMNLYYIQKLEDNGIITIERSERLEQIYYHYIRISRLRYELSWALHYNDLSDAGRKFLEESEEILITLGNILEKYGICNELNILEYINFLVEKKFGSMSQEEISMLNSSLKEECHKVLRKAWDTKL